MFKLGIEILLGMIFGPLIIFGIIKIISNSKIGAGSIWKIFLSIISVAIMFLICYGFYLSAIWLWPTPEQLVAPVVPVAPVAPPETASKSKPPKEEVKEEVWDWTFEWEASEQQMASGQAVRGRVNEAQLLSCDDLTLKFRYKRQQNGEILDLTLTRKNRNEPYFGRVAQNNLYLRVWLMPDPKEPGNFKGQFDNGPGTISLEVFLKKKI